MEQEKCIRNTNFKCMTLSSEHSYIDKAKAITAWYTLIGLNLNVK